MIIRRATIEDLPQIIIIDRESIIPSWSKGAFIRESDSANSCFNVAVIERTIVGFCILKRTGDEAEIHRIAVYKPYRKRGIADKLMISMLSYASDNKLKSIYLEVRKSNKAAIALYEKHGFNHLGTRYEYYTDPIEDAITMERSLTAAGGK